MVDFLFIIELFRYFVRFRRYKQKSVEVGVFRRGRWVTFGEYLGEMGQFLATPVGVPFPGPFFSISTALALTVK